MQPSFKAPQFEEQWLKIAEEVCSRILVVPEIQTMRERVKAGVILTPEDRSDFISISNRVKYEVIHELFGLYGTDGFKVFREAWKHWFNNKNAPKFQLEHRRLTNAEHIVYSSTPDPEEFLTNS